MFGEALGGNSTTIWELVKHGGMTMLPLALCSVIGWVVIFERILRFRTLNRSLRSFHLEAMNALLRQEWDDVKKLCAENEGLPTA